MNGYTMKTSSPATAGAGACKKIRDAVLDGYRRMEEKLAEAFLKNIIYGKY